MKVEIDTESEEFRKLIENSIVNSDSVQERIEQLFDNEEIRKAIVERIKSIIMSDEMTKVIKKNVKTYITDTFDISDYNEITDTIIKVANGLIKSKFEKGE